MDEQLSDKTHEATPHRREKAAEDGQVPRSQDLSASILSFVGLLLLMYFGQSVADMLGAEMRSHLGGEAWLKVEKNDAATHAAEVVTKIFWTIAPILGVLVALAIGVNLGQVGFLWLPDKVSPDISHIDPMAGTERIFSMGSVVRLGMGIIKVIIGLVVAGYCLWNEQAALASLPARDIGQIAAYIFTTCINIGLKVSASLLALAVLDYLYQWWKHEEDLKMTTQEVREEMKQMQGDPHIIQRRRQIMRQMVMGNVGKSVPKADVIVTNPTELAIALKYDMAQMAAPIVVAKGAGLVAQNIRRLGLENNIPIVERKELARTLYKDCEVNQPVPVEQYAAVAEVLKYVYELKGIKPVVPKRAA